MTFHHLFSFSKYYFVFLKLFVQIIHLSFVLPFSGILKKTKGRHSHS